MRSDGGGTFPNQGPMAGLGSLTVGVNYQLKREMSLQDQTL